MGVASGDSIQQPSEPPFYFQLAKGVGDWRASVILHDFNNQLAIILSHCSIALTKLPMESSARANLERAVRATKRAADLSSQLQVGMAIEDVEMTAINLNQFIQETLEAVETLIPASITLETHYAPDIPTVVLNPLLTYRTLLNVLLNAIESIGPGTGQIKIATDLITVAEVTKPGSKNNFPPGQYVAFQVSDTGRGMDQEILDQIFTPYYSTKPLGMGLGLTLAYHTIQVHKGIIQVQSTPNHGTVFHFLFPLQT